MPSELAPYRASELTRRQRRAVEATRFSTAMRVTEVRATAIVQHECLREVDGLARAAMAGQSMLSRWAATLAQGDPMVADELRFFTDLARMGKGEIIADTIDHYSRGGR